MGSMRGFSFPKKLRNIAGRIPRWFAILSAVTGAVIMMLAVIDVIGSKFFSMGIPGQLELIQYLNVIVVFGALAYVAQQGGHMRIDTIDPYIPAGLRYFFRIISYILEILTCAFFSWLAISLIRKLYLSKEMAGGMNSYPLWPFAVIAFSGFGLLTIVIIYNCIKLIISGPEKYNNENEEKEECPNL